MNQTTKIIIAVIILAVLIGGGIYLWQQNSENKNTNTNNKVQNNSNTNQNGELKKVVVSKENFIRDEYDFNSAEIEEDILKLDITYSGGCEDHTFNLVWSGDFLETSPVQADLLLSHDSQDDACEAAIKNTLQFDLTPLKEAYEDSYGKVENIIINFSDFDNSVHKLTYEDQNKLTCTSDSDCTDLAPDPKWGTKECWYKCPIGPAAGTPGSLENPGVCKACPPSV